MTPMATVTDEASMTRYLQFAEAYTAKHGRNADPRAAWNEVMEYAPEPPTAEERTLLVRAISGAKEDAITTGQRLKVRRLLRRFSLY